VFGCCVIVLGVPERKQKQTKTSGRFPDLKIFSSKNKCFDDSRFCLIFSFGGNYEILVETILVETILVETNIFWLKLLLFGGN
jgi:hypothetical protein